MVAMRINRVCNMFSVTLIMQFTPAVHGGIAQQRFCNARCNALLRLRRDAETLAHPFCVQLIGRCVVFGWLHFHFIELCHLLLWLAQLLFIQFPVPIWLVIVPAVVRICAVRHFLVLVDCASTCPHTCGSSLFGPVRHMLDRTCTACLKQSTLLDPAIISNVLSHP